jgi:hypothetical protein
VNQALVQIPVIIVTGFEKRGHLEQNKKKDIFAITLKQTMRGAQYSLNQVIFSIGCAVIVH